ncbi:hypothetical protein [Peribacillus butanolivorans]
MLKWEDLSQEKKAVTIIGFVTLFLSIPTLFFEWLTTIVFVTCGITGLILAFIKSVNSNTLYTVILVSLFVSTILVTSTPNNNWDNAISLFSFGLGIILILRKENLSIIQLIKEEEFSKHKYWYVANKMKQLAETGEFRNIGHAKLDEIAEILGIEPEDER